MSSIDPAVMSVIAAKNSALKSEIGFAIAAKQLNAARHQGEAVNQLLKDAAQLSRAIGKGAGFDILA